MPPERLAAATEPAIADFDGRNVSRTDVPIMRAPSGAGGGSPLRPTSTDRFFALASGAGDPALITLRSGRARVGDAPDCVRKALWLARSVGALHLGSRGAHSSGRVSRAVGIARRWS